MIERFIEWFIDWLSHRVKEARHLGQVVGCGCGHELGAVPAHGRDVVLGGDCGGVKGGKGREGGERKEGSEWKEMKKEEA